MASGMENPPPYTEYNHPEYNHQEYNHPKAMHGGYSVQSFPPHQQPQPQQTHQQQQVVIVQAQDAPTFVYRPHPVSMTGAIVLSCIVFWCFGWLFGAIAFILAMIGSDSSQNGDISGALRLRNASYGVSVAGILIGIIVIVVIIIFVVSNANQTHGSTCMYTSQGKVCY
jgi:hypothetical protein